MVLIAVIVGIAGGYGAVLFRLLIGLFQKIFFGTGDRLFLQYLLDLPWYAKLVPPIIGGAIVGPVLYFFAPEGRGPGVTEVIAAVALRGGQIRRRVCIIKTLASAVCIGSGGSAGREGPIVQIGAAIGSLIGQTIGVTADRMRTLVACGAAAGIAATFNAPIAGVMFAVEIILGNLSITSFSPVVVSSVIATVVARIHLGENPAFFIPHYSLVSLFEIPLYLLLGIVAGVVGVCFTLCLYTTEDLFKRIRIPDYAKAALGATCVGVIGIFLPHVFGVGYDVVDATLWEKLSWQIVFILIFMKMIATSLTIGSGSSGGIFGPSLFIGAMTGAVFGHFAHLLFPSITATAGAYACVGMGAVVAATTHGPLHAMLIIFESTGDYKIIVPLMTACIISYLVASQINRESIFTLKLMRRGIDIKSGREINILKSLRVERAMTTQVETVREDMTLKELLQFTLSSKYSSFPVVDRDGRLSGIISFQDFKEIVLEEGLEDLIVVKDIATEKVITVYKDESLDAALGKIGFRNIEHLPVVDSRNPRRIIGILSRRDIFTAYNKALIDRSVSEGLQDGGDRETP